MPETIIPTISCQSESKDRGRFVVEPLEPGYGITLGNAMRRVLLGCLPGAAVTAVKIDGVQHEFSTIPHMKEDTMEFLLNLKGIRLRYLSNRSDTLTLDVVGEKEVCAGDIRPSTVFEIMNPEHHLAILEGPDASLHVELNAEIGRGYVTVGSSEGRPIGVLPIDAVFTPVRRVNYRVEKARVGDSSDFDRLILDVWTDGTISPEDAVAESARMLMKQFSTFANIGKAPEEIVEVIEEPQTTSEKQDMPLEQLGLSSRTFNALRRGGISTTGQLLEKSKDELLGLKNFGEKSWNEVQQRLIELGLAEPEHVEGEEEGGEEMPAAEGEEGVEKVDLEEMKRKLQERFQVREER
ncbi:MAG: DNA-directed RNA polymerase subunit alpha [Chloroflexi bacterium]|nr:DNA-directed RNA polymerase subunit alpha [Chloroflexota bacterium]